MLLPGVNLVVWILSGVKILTFFYDVRTTTIDIYFKFAGKIDRYRGQIKLDQGGAKLTNNIFFLHQQWTSGHVQCVAMETELTCIIDMWTVISAFVFTLEWYICQMFFFFLIQNNIHVKKSQIKWSRVRYEGLYQGVGI